MVHGHTTYLSVIPVLALTCTISKTNDEYVGICTFDYFHHSIQAVLVILGMQHKVPGNPLSLVR